MTTPRTDTTPRTAAGRALHNAEMFDLSSQEDRRRLALAIEAEAAEPAPLDDLIGLARSGAAFMHLNNVGLFKEHRGKFAECPDQRCVKWRDILAAAGDKGSDR